jgi:hypothetical protein
MWRDTKSEVRRLLCVLQLRICAVSTGSDERRVLHISKLITSTLLDLLIYPIIYLVWRRRELPAEAAFN